MALGGTKACSQCTPVSARRHKLVTRGTGTILRECYSPLGPSDSVPEQEYVCECHGKQMLKEEEERETKLRKQSAGMVSPYTTTDQFSVHVFCCHVVKDHHSLISV